MKLISDQVKFRSMDEYIIFLKSLNTGLPTKDEIVKTIWNSLNMTRVELSLLPLLSFYCLFNDLKKNETSFKLLEIMNIRKQTV